MIKGCRDVELIFNSCRTASNLRRPHILLLWQNMDATFYQQAGLEKSKLAQKKLGFQDHFVGQF